MIKIDLHVHTKYSYDAITTLKDLEEIFKKNRVDQLAITDHDEIKGAKLAQSEFGQDKIVVGQEITLNNKKHMIGLFLSEFVPRGLSPVRTAQLIRSQGGLVYLPHLLNPKHGVGEAVLKKLIKMSLVDIVESHNSWNYKTIFNYQAHKSQNVSAQKAVQKLNMAQAASSDAHTPTNIGRSYSKISELATSKNLVEQLSSAEFNREYSTIGPSQIQAGLKAVRYFVKKKIPFI